MTDKSKHANAQTRYGNGKGHGGAAKGAGKAIPTIQNHPEFEAGNKMRELGKSYRTLSREQRLEAIREAQWVDAFDPDLVPRDRFAARVDLQNRMDGLPVQKIVTPDNAPSWFILGEPEAESVEAWTAQADLAAAKPQGSAD